MTDADRALIAAMIVFVTEAVPSTEIEVSLAAADRALQARDRMQESPCPGIVAAAEETLRAWRHGGLWEAQNRRNYVRLALAEYFIPRRDAALRGLPGASAT